MKTRTTTVQPDVIKASGSAWGHDLPEIIIEQYGDGGVVKRVVIPVRPVDLEEMARVFWELRQKYQSALNDMTRALKGE